MKRSVSGVDDAQQSRCRQTSKRHKPRHLRSNAPGASPPPSHPSHPSSQPSQGSQVLSSQSVALTEKVLEDRQQQPAPEERQSSIQRWLKSSPADCDPNTMAAPPTPQSASSSSRGRRPARRQVRASRTPSPNKRPTPQTYRVLNMSYSGLLIDRLAELPAEIERGVRNILGLESLHDAIGVIENQSQLAAHMARFLDQSRHRARICSLEGDWKAILSSLIDDLAPASIRCHTSEKPWTAYLKPTPPEVAQPEDDSRSPITILAPSQPALPEYDLQSASGFPGTVPSLRPYTSSVAYTTSTEAADPFHISTPKPDIVVGLAEEAFSPMHRMRLASYQSSGLILSDPHTAAMGLRFPFLIAELKGLSSNGGLVAAQNQAAVGGACMLRILDDLETQAVVPAAPSTLRAIPRLCFSVTTEGPVHELWVHFSFDESIHMQNIRTWRTTHQRDVRELVYCLAKIMEWGNGEFMNNVQEVLKRLPS